MNVSILQSGSLSVISALTATAWNFVFNKLFDSLAVYQRGHVPVIGEWLALPLAKAAGSTSLGDDIAESMLYPVAHRLIAKCDAIYRIAGASKGADMDIEVARELGLTIYTTLESIPQA